MKVIYVVGSGHSGSTILDLVLGSHSRIVGCGELKNLAKLLRREAGQSDCTCGSALDACPFWKAVFEEAPELHAALRSGDHHLLPGRSEFVARLRGSVRDPRLVRAAEGEHSLMRAIASVAGAEVVVDSSKSPARLLRLLQTPGLDVHVVHLYKSLPEYRASMTRRHASALESFVLWTRTNLVAGWLGGRAPRFFRLRHADFLDDPERWTAALCRWVGLEPEPGMLHYWESEHHNASGNVLRFEQVPVGGHRRPKWTPSAKERTLYHGLLFSALQRWIDRPSGPVRSTTR